MTKKIENKNVKSKTKIENKKISKKNVVKKTKEIKKESFNHTKIEKVWKNNWNKTKLYLTKIDTKKKKKYILDMFPYPSGDGLHVGHPKGYIATDVYSRLKRMQGYNVLRAMGWDAFGLPAEQYAIKMKMNPAVLTKKNVARYKEQLELIGLNYDWSREIDTTDPTFYKWTQWAIKQMHKKGLMHESFEPINWCPSCKTGLANEDLEDGKCERCSSVVEKKPIRQWVIKITDYAEKLLSGLEDVNWKENIKDMQRNWIGKSEGAEIDFKIVGKDFEDKFTIFTTRPDTLFGCTYCVFAPEGKIVKDLLEKNLIENKDEVEKYIEEAKNKTEIERSAEGKEKTGVELKGIKAINPANQKQVPIYIADYVLGNYGTGAIMAVPAHDERDYEFAKKYNIEIIQVVEKVFIQKDHDSAFRQNEKVVYRDTVCVAVRNPKTNKYLGISWKNIEMNGFITGGIEEGQTVEVAARNEVLEETGYKNLKLNFISPLIEHTKFWHRQKQVNRHARWNFVSFDLIDEEKENIAEEESKLHNVVWFSEKEVQNLSVEESQFMAKILLNKNFLITEFGVLSNSESFNGMNSEEAKREIVKFVGGKMVTKYKLRDWVFARQRYWGEPFPIVFDENHKAFVVADKELPVVLPNVKSYEPTGTGESPLANIKSFTDVYGFINKDGEFESYKGKVTKEILKKGKIKLFKRETNTMPQWAGSSWYWLRYMDPKNKKSLVDKKVEKYWGQVDLYCGGMEHATRHLIYGRFWNRFLYDIKAISTKEPFNRLEGVGLIMAGDGRKMSKRYGNVINPDDVIAKFGADTFRLYEMFIGAFHDTVAWSEDGIIGPRRFVEKVWALQYKATKKKNENKKIETLLHQTIKKVSEDYEKWGFNTAISQMMIFVNSIEEEIDIEYYKILLKLLAPVCPFFTEEIWKNLGEKKSVHISSWPKYDAKKTIENTVKLPIQINGKLRGTISIDINEGEESVIEKVKSTDVYKNWIEGKEIKKIIYLSGRILNIVV